MLNRMLLWSMLVTGGGWLATVAMAAPVPVASAAAPVAAPMCAPELPEAQPPTLDCTPRGGGCRYSHECCSNICRTIKGEKSCS